MLRLLTLLLLLLPGLVCAQAIEVGTRFSDAWSDTVDGDILSAAGTVPAGAELLICYTFTRGNRDALNANWNGSESMTEIVDYDDPGNTTSDPEVSVWALLNPTAATDDVTVEFDQNLSGDHFSILCTSWDGVDTASIGDATNVDSAVADETDGGVTILFPNFGSAGNTLLLCGAKNRANSDPSSFDDVDYTEIFDRDTGGGVNNSSDAGIGCHKQEDIAGADGGTLTFQAGNDETVGVQIEIVAGSGLDLRIVRRHWE